MRIRYTQGSDRRWRWILHDTDGHVIALCDVRGYDTSGDAVEAAQRAKFVFNQVLEG